MGILSSNSALKHNPHSTANWASSHQTKHQARCVVILQLTYIHTYVCGSACACTFSAAQLSATKDPDNRKVSYIYFGLMSYTKSLFLSTYIRLFRQDDRLIIGRYVKGLHQLQELLGMEVLINMTVVVVTFIH